MSVPRRFLYFLLLTPTLLGFDLWTKDKVVESLGYRDEISLIDGWLSFVHAENPGVAFGISVPMGLIIGIGVLMIGLLAYTLYNLEDSERGHAIAIALVSAGALGNLVDRLQDGTVTDFIRVYTEHPAMAPWLVEQFGTATFPIFNVADIAICVGIGLFLVLPLFMEDEGEPAAA